MKMRIIYSIKICGHVKHMVSSLLKKCRCRAGQIYNMYCSDLGYEYVLQLKDPKIGSLTIIINLIFAFVNDSLYLVNWYKFFLNVVLVNWCIVEWIKLNSINTGSQFIVALLLRWKFVKLCTTVVSYEIRFLFNIIENYISIGNDVELKIS